MHGPGGSHGRANAQPAIPASETRVNTMTWRFYADVRIPAGGATQKRLPARARKRCVDSGTANLVARTTFALLGMRFDALLRMCRNMSIR